MKKQSLTYNHYKNAMTGIDFGTSKIFLSFGPSEYLKIKTEEWFIKKHNHSCNRLVGEKVSTSDLDQIFFQDSIFDPTSLFVIKSIDKKNDFAKILASISQASSVRNIVLLQSSYKTIPKALAKEVDRLKITGIPCYDPNTYELKRFTAALAKRFQLNLTEESLSLISEAIGDDLFALENEIRKLSLIFAESDPSQSLGIQEIAKYVDYLREENAFKIDQFIIDRKSAKAQALLLDLLKRGQSPLAVLGILSNHCRKALSIGDMVRQHKSVQEIIKVNRMPMAVLKSYVNYVKRVPAHQFKSTLFDCNQADIMMKTSRVDPDLILSRILVTLTS